MRQHPFAFRCKALEAAAAPDQAGIEFFLELAQARRERRLCHMASGGRAPEVALAGKRGEKGELAMVQRCLRNALRSVKCPDGPRLMSLDRSDDSSDTDDSGSGCLIGAG